jgi:hydrogenase nickel incorporation protein HypA/HybF
MMTLKKRTAKDERVHEFGLMANVLEQTEKACREAGAVRVTRIRLVAGEMTEVLPEALEFALEALGAGTVAEGATLCVERPRPRSRCTQCGYEFENDRFSRACPTCGALATELLAGRELYIKDMEIER